MFYKSKVYVFILIIWYFDAFLFKNLSLTFVL